MLRTMRGVVFLAQGLVIGPSSCGWLRYETDIVSEVRKSRRWHRNMRCDDRGNDARNGVSSATYEANIASMSQTLRSGHHVYWLLIQWKMRREHETLNTWIANPAGCNCSYIDVNNGFRRRIWLPSTWLAGDSVHPAQVFHTYIAQTIADAYKVTREAAVPVLRYTVTHTRQG